MSGEKSCETCFNWLGGIYDCCRLNLEKECREGGFEAWEPKRRKGQNHGGDGRADGTDRKEG